jgi:hypothetical protein
VLDATGKVREAKVASEPEALVAFLRGLGLVIARVGLEAGPSSQWLHDGLRDAGFVAVLLETRHVKAALSAWQSRPIVATRATSRSCGAWGGSARCIGSRCRLRVGPRSFCGLTELSQHQPD